LSVDEITRAAFVAHVRSLEERACSGDLDAAKSLACMALLAEGHSPSDPGGGVVIDLSQYRMAA
jgi:hypothetical protein